MLKNVKTWNSCIWEKWIECEKKDILFIYFEFLQLIIFILSKFNNVLAPYGIKLVKINYGYFLLHWGYNIFLIRNKHQCYALFITEVPSTFVGSLIVHLATTNPPLATVFLPLVLCVYFSFKIIILLSWSFINNMNGFSVKVEWTLNHILLRFLKSSNMALSLSANNLQGNRIHLLDKDFQNFLTALETTWYTSLTTYVYKHPITYSLNVPWIIIKERILSSNTWKYWKMKCRPVITFLVR